MFSAVTYVARRQRQTCPHGNSDNREHGSESSQPSSIDVTKFSLCPTTKNFQKVIDSEYWSLLMSRPNTPTSFSYDCIKALLAVNIHKKMDRIHSGCTEGDLRHICSIFVEFEVGTWSYDVWIIYVTPCQSTPLIQPLSRNRVTPQFHESVP